MSTLFVTRLVRAIALGPDETLWSGHYNRYEIELWSLDGEHLATLVRDAPWFRPYEETTGPPRPTLRALAQDDAGRLWVLITMPDPERGAPRFEPDSPAVWHQEFDTIVEVLDPGEGRVLASYRHPKLIERFVAAGILPIIEEREDGALVVEVWQVDIRGLSTPM